MQNRWVQKLHDLEDGAEPQKLKTGLPSALTKPTKPPFVSFDGETGRPISNFSKAQEKGELFQRRITEKSENAIPSDRQNRQNPRSPYGHDMGALRERCPDLIPMERWERCVADAGRFLPQWGEQAAALGWTPRDLLGLHQPPERPHPSYSRLSRYDHIGLLWLLQGREVVTLTEATAAIRSATGAMTVYRRHNRLALGPLGDSLDDLI